MLGKVLKRIFKGKLCKKESFESYILCIGGNKYIRESGKGIEEIMIDKEFKELYACGRNSFSKQDFLEWGNDLYLKCPKR